MKTLATLIDSALVAERAGAWDEALAGYEAAFGHLRTEGDAAKAAELLRRIGRVHRERGDIELAIEAFETSLAIAEANGLREHVAAALNGLGTAEQFRGGLEAAEQLYTQARALAAQAADQRLTAVADQNLGILSNIRGDVASALIRYQSALERYRLLGDDLTAARALNNMGMAHIDLADWNAAEACFAEAIGLAASAGDMVMVGVVELNRAELFLQRQQFEHAREACARAVEMFSRLRAKPRVAEAYKFYGILYRETSKLDQANLHFALSLGLAEASQDRLLEAEVQSEWALVHLEQSQPREALRCLNRAHKIFGQLKARRELWDIERRLKRLEKSYLPAARAWGEEASESRDGYMRGHARRVAEYSTSLATALGLASEEVNRLHVGALVHDVGVAALPEPVLCKAGRLNKQEWELVQSHTVVGDAMVAELGFPGKIRSIVRSHHENWDGGGYPDGLAKEQIPLAARIVRIAEVYDALGTPRRYRPAYQPQEALQIMEREAGQQLDPELFHTFRELQPIAA
ncbi:MAG: tetratricopeptide repeat protein [Gemmatimonadetes bacterium]|nr:tetratricopeptide repeat protein [Gemmatimonadota bacterium]